MLCRLISGQLGYDFYVASELIQKYQESALPRNKRVEDIEGNQEILIEALRLCTGNNGGKRVLLEGHACLINKQSRIERIPFEVFMQLDISHIILLVINVNTAQTRLYKRDKILHPAGLLDKLQMEEISYVKEISSKLKVLMLTAYESIDIGTIEAFLS